MRLLVCLLVLINITYTIGLVEDLNAKTKPQTHEVQNIPHLNLNNYNKTNNATTPNPVVSVSVVNKLPHLDDDGDIMKSGALLRGFYVIIAITLLLLGYIGFRMFRIQKSNQPPVMVRKYGVLANRGDVEMLPLPLSDEEDDDTVFELNNHTNR